MRGMATNWRCWRKDYSDASLLQPGQAEVKKEAASVLHGPERDMADGMGGTGAG